jgi:hypothetical protein
MESKPEPSYYGILPAVVRYADIPPGAKVLYSELSALTRREGFAWATNAYFAELYGVSIKTISDWVGKLVSAGFIKIEVDHEGGNRRKIWLAGAIEKNVMPIEENVQTYTQKGVEGYGRKLLHNNTSINSKKEYTGLNGDVRKIFDIYPKRLGKPAACVAIAKAIKTYGIDFITERTSLYAQYNPPNSHPYIPNPATWFSQERFNDDPRTWKRFDSVENAI